MFRNGSYATVWSIEPGRFKGTMRGRISTSYKNRDTGEYIQDFSKSVEFRGDAGEKAASLKEKDRIKFLDVGMSSRYDKAAEKEYDNFIVYNFDMADAANDGSASGSPSARRTATQPTGYSPSEEGDISEDGYVPF